jgi:hypothetical protein
MGNRYKYIDENKEHMHTLDGKPLFGTSTVVKIIAKPLTWWAAGKALEPFGWTNSKLRINGKYRTVPDEQRLDHLRPILEGITKMGEKEYLSLLDSGYRAHDEVKKTAGVKGTDRHAILESYVKWCLDKNGGVPLGVTDVFDVAPDQIIQSFIVWALKNVKQFLWSEANCYSEELWTGGIADVGWLDHNDRVIGGDFKSSKEAYMDQFIQIAGYDLMLSENGGVDKDGNKKFDLPNPIQGYCVVPFGAPTLEPNFQWDVESLRKGFKAALHLHKLNVSFA